MARRVGAGRSTRPARPPSSTAAFVRAAVGRSPAGVSTRLVPRHASWTTAACRALGCGAARQRRPHRRHVAVSGLCGTGSHDFVLDRVFVPDDHTFTVFQPGGLEGTLGRIPELVSSALAIATVAVGIAQGALADITTLATAKVPMFADGTLASNPLFRYRLAEANTHLRAAKALPMPTLPTPGRPPRRTTSSPRSGGPGSEARRPGRRKLPLALLTWPTGRRWDGVVLEQSPPAATPRRPCRHPTLRGQTGHVHLAGRCSPTKTRPHLPVTAGVERGNETMTITSADAPVGRPLQRPRIATRARPWRQRRPRHLRPHRRHARRTPYGVGYSRRGRGGSGDGPGYALEREVEDVRAVLAVAATVPILSDTRAARSTACWPPQRGRCCRRRAL